MSQCINEDKGQLMLPWIEEASLVSLSEEKMKKCSKCKKMIPYPSGFHKSGFYKGKQIYRSQCKECTKLDAQSPKRKAVALRKRAKRRNKKDKLPFDIDLDYIRTLYVKVCPYANISLVYQGGRKRIYPDSPSLDKIIPSLGYVKGNVQIISPLGNNVKSSLTPEQWEIPLRIAQHLKYLHDGKPIPVEAFHGSKYPTMESLI